MVSKVQTNTIVKIVRVAPPHLPPQGAWLDHSHALHLEKLNISFSAVRMPQNCLDRPKVCPKDVLGPFLATRQAGEAVSAAVEAFAQAEKNLDMPVGLPLDGTQVADRMALLQFDPMSQTGLPVPQTGGACALLLVADAAHGELVLLPPEGLEQAAQANGQHQAQPQAQLAQTAPNPYSPFPERPYPRKDAPSELGSILGLTEGELALAAQNATVHAANVARRRAAAAAAATAGGSAPAEGDTAGDPGAAADASAGPSQSGGTVIWILWAEAHLERISPSMLLGYALLASRRESALFLRMATGFGFAQMGDYNASSFYRFAKRGHRFKCWECGVKKKAPCGEVDRPDLPWCCHRRLGAYLPLLTASKTGTTPDTIALQSKSVCFVPLLPPKDAQTDPTDPLGLQLAHIPPPASVVALAELLVHKPAHPVECIGTALARLAPTCRSLWDTPWITEKRAKVLSGDEESVGEMHRWLEKTAFFKMPRSQEAELVSEMKQPFEELVGEVVPDVEGAPCLGGHNRSGADGAASAPTPTVKMVDPELGISSDAVRRKRMVNTGQGRRRLNARAALRTVAIAGRAGERSGSPGQLPGASGLSEPSAAGSEPGGAPDGQQPGSSQAPTAQPRPAAKRPAACGRGRGRGRPPKSRRAESDSEAEEEGGRRGFSDPDEDGLDEAMQGLEALQHASPPRQRRAAAAQKPGPRTRRSLSPPRDPEGKSPVSSPDVAKMRPPRKMRSGPKRKSSEAEETADDQTLDNEEWGDQGGDMGPDGGSVQHLALEKRRSPRMAGKPPAGGLPDDVARAAKRQRRSASGEAEPARQDFPSAKQPAARPPGRPRKYPLPPDALPKRDEASTHALRPSGSQAYQDSREYERQMRSVDADLAAADAFARGGSIHDGGAQRSASSGGGGSQQAYSGGPGSSASGAGAQVRGSGGPQAMRRPVPTPMAPGMRARAAVPLLVLQPEQLQRAESGLLALPAQISNLLSAGSIQVLISSSVPARTINDRGSLETLSRFLAGAPPYRPMPGGPRPQGGSGPSGGPRLSAGTPGRAPGAAQQQAAAETPRSAPAALPASLPRSGPVSVPNGQGPQVPLRKAEQAPRALPAPPSQPQLAPATKGPPDAAVTITMASQQQPAEPQPHPRPPGQDELLAKGSAPAMAPDMSILASQPQQLDSRKLGAPTVWQPTVGAQHVEAS